VGGRDTLHDRQTQAGAAAISVRLSVRVEDDRESIGGDAHAGVLDLELELRARVDDAHGDAPTRWSKANRVGGEVDDELIQPFFVAEIREVRPIALPFQRDAGFFGLGMKVFDDAIDECREVDRLAIKLREPGAETRHLEDLVGEP
jgi:hypothetical protein